MGSANARNVDYAPGLRALLEQLNAASVKVIEAYVDSGRVQTMPLDDRRILSVEDVGIEPTEQLIRLSQRMRRVGRTSDQSGGNNNKLIRLCTDAGAQALKSALHLAPASINVRSLNRIPEADFDLIKPHHVWMAVEALRTRTDWSPYSPSID